MVSKPNNASHFSTEAMYLNNNHYEFSTGFRRAVTVFLQKFRYLTQPVVAVFRFP